MSSNSPMMKGLVIGLLAGGAIGAVLALLYAPKSGRELRAELRDKAEDLMEGAEDYMNVARTKAGDIVSEAKRRSDGIITDAKKKAGSLLEDADRVITGAREKAGSITEESGRLKNAVKAGVDAYRDERRKS